ncbi:hypothetical protein WJX77_003485 [Trebouxia sp. C0004]
MRDTFSELAEHEAARSRGEEPLKTSLLEKLQGKLEQEMIPDLSSYTIDELEGKLSRLKNVKGLADGGAKLLAQCQHLEAEIRRREEKSKGWLRTAEKNQAEAKRGVTGQPSLGQMHSSHPNTETTQQQRSDRLRASRNFDGDDEPSTSQARPPFLPQLQKSGQSKPKAGQSNTLSATILRSNFGHIPTQVTSYSRRDTDRQTCEFCTKLFPVKDLRWQQVMQGDGLQCVCQECWRNLKPGIPYPQMDNYQTSTLKGNRPVVNSQQTGLQPAPIKVGKSNADPLYEPSQGRKISARQSAKLQKQQHAQKQADNEPICIDSDEDDHAAGSVPARESPQNGAGPELRRSERTNLNQSTTVKFKDMRCVYPPDRKLDVVEMTEYDLARLDDGEFLNDTVIDFYAKWIQENLDKDIQLKYHFFNTFFFKKLTEKSTVKKNLSGNAGRESTPDSDAIKALTPAERNHLRVKSWTKGVDIFSKDFLLIPIHDALHWSLIIVCHPGLDFQSGERRPYILHLDSMQGSCHNLSVISKAIRTYLNVEWQRKLDEQDTSSVPVGWVKEHPGITHNFEPSTMPGKTAHVPCQDNYWDCGLFVLAYLDFWTHAPPDQVELCERGAWKGETPYPAFLSKHWFQHENASALRGHIRNEILKLFRVQKRLPDNHPSMVAAVVDMEEYEEDSKRKYCSPAEYLAAARAAHKQREEDKAKKDAWLKEDKERKAAEQAAKAAEAKRKAGEKAAEREEKRLEEIQKQQEMSQDDSLEVDLLGDTGIGHESPPTDFVPPEFVTLHQPRIEEASNRQRRKRASPDDPPQPALDVQDLTGESPEAKMRLRSGHTKIHNSGQPADPDLANTRRSSRRQAAAANQRIDDNEDEDDEDERPATKRQLVLPAAEQVQSQPENEEAVDPADSTLVPDSQPEERQPETQDLTQEGHITDELNSSADLLERADRAQQEASRQGSGFHDDAELREYKVIDGWHSHEADRSQQQLNGTSPPATLAGSSGQWSQALLTTEHASTPQQHSLSTSQQTHHARIRNMQQQHAAHVSPQHQGQGSFPAGKVSKFFAGNLHKHTSAASLPQPQTHMLLKDPSAVPGLSHDDKEGSPESISDPSSLPPMSAAAPQQSPPPQSSSLLQPPPPHSASMPAASPAHGALPFPEPLLVLKSVDGFMASHAQSAQYDYPPPDTEQALVHMPTCDNSLRSAASQPAVAGGNSVHSGLPGTAWTNHSPGQQPVNGQASDIGSDKQGISSPVQTLRRRAAKSHHHKDMKLAAVSAENSVHADPMKRITMMTVVDKSCVVSPRSKKLKLSPLPGLSLSPVKPAGAQWPPDANALHQYGQPAATSPAGAGRAANSIAVRTNSWRAAPSSGRQESTAMDLDLDPSNVVDLFQGVPSPSAHKAQQQVSGTSSLQNPYGVVAASDADLRKALSNVQSSANKQKDLVDVGGHDSVQSLKAADTKAAQMQEQLQQQRPLQRQQLGLAETPGSTAIDLCDDDLAPKGPHLSAALTEQQVKADEQMARSLQQTGAPLQQLSLQDHVSDNNDSDWQPSPSRSKRSEASYRQAGSIRRKRQTQGAHQTKLSFTTTPLVHSNEGRGGIDRL